MEKFSKKTVILILLFTLLSCDKPAAEAVADDPPTESEATLPEAVLGMDQLSYLGAFRLPKVKVDIATGNGRFGAGAGVITFHSKGDPDGVDDGFPGSLFVVGHVDNKVGQISIPAPQFFEEDELESLPIAESLMNFEEVTSGKGPAITKSGWVMQGLEVFKDKLLFTSHPYYNTAQINTAGFGMQNLPVDSESARGFCFLGDNDPDLRGPAEFHSSKTAGYLFQAPPAFCKEHLNGKCMIAGLTGVPGQGSSSWGPAMYAFDPLEHGEKPTEGCVYDALPLLYYPFDPNNREIRYSVSGFTRTNRYRSGAWVCTRTHCAIVFIGSVGRGEEFYDHRINVPGSCGHSGTQGYHAPPYESVLLFYDPADIAKSAAGSLQPWEVQPKAEARVKEVIPTCRGNLEGLAYDKDNQLLYLYQPGVDLTRDLIEEYPIVHVYKLR
jgi:hypothetical protein